MWRCLYSIVKMPFHSTYGKPSTDEDDKRYCTVGNDTQMTDNHTIGANSEECPHEEVEIVRTHIPCVADQKLFIECEVHEGRIPYNMPTLVHKCLGVT